GGRREAGSGAETPSAFFTRAPLAVLVAALLVAAAGLSHREWVRFDRPCWDHYCTAGRWIAAWAGGDITFAVLLERLRAWPHANSFLGPLVFGTAARLVDVEVVRAYRVLSAVSTIAAMALLHVFVLRPLHAERAVVWTAWWLAAAHPAVLRSFSFPQTDAMAMLWMTALMAVAFSGRFRRAAARQAAALVPATTGFFVKLSFYPALALMPLAVVLEPEPGDGRGVAARLTRGALLAAVPVAVFAAVCVGLGLEESVLAELRARNMETDSAPPIVAEALIKAVFPFAFWVWLGARRWGARERTLAAWTILFLAGLGLAQAAGSRRYHLVALPP